MIDFICYNFIMVDIYNQFRDFKSFDVVFLHNGELQKIICTVKSIENNSIVLDANNQKNKNIFASPGDELKLHIYTDNGIYSATSKILLATKGIVSTEYVIAYPANSKHSQRREYFRADMPIDFKLVLKTDTKEEIQVEAKTRNICGRGMSFLSDKPLPSYHSIHIDLLFKGKTISTSAMLVYSKVLAISGKPKFIHAFSFTNITKRNIDFIIKKCFLHQLDLRKKK